MAKAGFVETFDGNRQFTVFAPTDDAFDALYEVLGFDSIEDFDTDEEIELLQSVLLYHVANGWRDAASVLPDEDEEFKPIKTLQGSQFKVSVVGKEVKITESTYEKATIILIKLTNFQQSFYHHHGTELFLQLFHFPHSR